MCVLLQRQDPYKAAGVDESLVCGALAGIFSKGTIYPLDMVKKRLQVWWCKYSTLINARTF